MRYLISFLFLITLAISLACARQAAEIAATPQTAPGQSTPTASPTPVDDAPRIALEEAKKLYDDGKAFIVDSRPEEAYKQEHIKGAVNITANTLEARIKELPKDKTIIVYCS